MLYNRLESVSGILWCAILSRYCNVLTTLPYCVGTVITDHCSILSRYCNVLTTLPYCVGTVITDHCSILSRYCNVLTTVPYCLGTVSTDHCSVYTPGEVSTSSPNVSVYSLKTFFLWFFQTSVSFLLNCGTCLEPPIAVKTFDSQCTLSYRQSVLHAKYLNVLQYTVNRSVLSRYCNILLTVRYCLGTVIYWMPAHLASYNQLYSERASNKTLLILGRMIEL